MNLTKGMTVGALLTSFVLIAGLLVSLMLPAASPPVMAAQIGTHDITFVSHTYDGTYSTWTYNVTSGSSPSLSHWVISWCNGSAIVDVSENYEYGTDPTTGITGIKFEEGYKDGESRTVWFKLQGDYPEGLVKVGTKAGKKIAYGWVRGPLLCVTGTITAHKFNDLNGNGVQDDGEPDLKGWTMTLYLGSACSGDPLGSGDTDSNGNVVFTNLAAGEYSVKETLQDGWINTIPICQNVTLSADGSETLNFGNQQPGTITTIIYGYKWDDYSHDGEWDDFEPPLNGWTINLAGPESGTAVTGAEEWPDGYYEFKVCTSGDYIVSEGILTEEWHRTFPPDPGTYTVSVDVQNGPYGPYDFGNAQTCTIIYGYKWDDYNYDGEWDKPDEPPLKDWEIHLDGPVTSVTYTNTEGYYQFIICDVWGTFTVSEVVRGGYTQSYPSAPGMHQVVVDDLKKEYGPYDFGNWNPGMPVGGIIIPVNKLAILAPWIALAMAVIVGGVMVVALCL